MQNNTNPNNKSKAVALITGVSSPRDMGTAFCRALAAKGIDIFFTHWNSTTEWPSSFKKELEQLNVRCAYMEIDLSAADAASAVYNEATKQLGQPSILINNAAYSTNDDYTSLDAQVLDNHYAVNMRSTFLLCAEFARSFAASDLSAGRIINITSGQDLAPMPGELAYSATKGAISAFTRSLSRELAPLRITVNAINPGPTDSTWMNDEIRESLLPSFPMGRIGTPDDAARLVAFLVSEEAGWITGQIIHSEGGFMR